jgi:hypothetical protein
MCTSTVSCVCVSTSRFGQVQSSGGDELGLNAETKVAQNANAMKEINREIDPRTRAGHVTLRPEEAEDMWHLYHIIGLFSVFFRSHFVARRAGRCANAVTASGNIVKGTTIRRIQSESSTGSIDSQRVKLVLAVRAEKIDFEPGEHTIHIGVCPQSSALARCALRVALRIEGPCRRGESTREAWCISHTRFGAK